MSPTKPETEIITYVRQLVSCKYEVDAALSSRRHLPYGFEETWPDGWVKTWRTLDPHTFMRAVWPYWEGRELSRSRTTNLDWVEPDVVIGASDSWRPQDMTDEEISELFRKTDGQARHFENTGKWESHIDGLGYIGAHPVAWELVPFGLYVAHEGKNRVAAFALHGKPIAYDVRQVYFPPATELALEQQNGQWQLHWTGRGVRDIRYFAEILVPIFKAYGVQVREATRIELGEPPPSHLRQFFAWLGLGARE